jgi:hypothetical protein
VEPTDRGRPKTRKPGNIYGHRLSGVISTKLSGVVSTTAVRAKSSRPIASVHDVVITDLGHTPT